MKIKNAVLSSAFALAGLFASTESSAATVVVNVSSVSQLYAAFQNADLHPADWYEVRLAPGYYPLVCASSTGDTTSATSGSLKLHFGKVRLIGAPNERSASDFAIDGGRQGSASCSSFFYLEGSTGNQPQLEISGVKLQNGGSRSSRAPIEVSRARLTINHSYIQGTRSPTLPGGAVYAFSSVVNIFDTFIQDAALTNIGPGQCTVGVFPVGGALYIANSTARISNSTITSSGACRGGAIYYTSSSSIYSLTVEQSTIAQNFARNRGGAILATGSGKLTLLFNTIAQNLAAMESSGSTNEPRYGGGLAFVAFTGALTMYGNLIAQNVAQHPFLPGSSTVPNGNDCYVDGSFTTTRTLGTQLLGERGTCTFVSTGPLVGTSASPVNPQFWGLASVPTLWDSDLDMFLLQPTSPAMNAFPGTWPLTCPGSDQAGNPRVPPCDLGSVETLF